MKRPRMCRVIGVAIVCLASALLARARTDACGETRRACLAGPCAGLQGHEQHACVRRCRRERCPGAVGVRTFAYVVSECTENADGTGFVGHQSLRVQRGEHAPVTVPGMEFRTVDPVADFYNLLTGRPVCQSFGEVRLGDSSLAAGVFERLGVTPDGSGVVFEVTNDFELAISKLRLAPDKQGIFFVRADGSGLRRITERTSRVPPYQVDFGPPCCAGSFSPQLPFSHDGRTVLLTDRGQGVGGEECPGGMEPVQIFALDIFTGVWSQVTHLPCASSRDPLLPSTGY